MQRRACLARVIVRVTWPHEGGGKRWEAGKGEGRGGESVRSREEEGRRKEKRRRYV